MQENIREFIVSRGLSEEEFAALVGNLASLGLVTIINGNVEASDAFLERLGTGADRAGKGKF